MDKLGRYRIIDELGRGGAGIVYRALDPAIDRLVAIKTVRVEGGAGPSPGSRKEQLLREARTAAKLSHANIVTVYDVGVEGEVLYVAMELIEGLTLERLLKQREVQCRTIVFDHLPQVANALDYAHSRGIVHRDVKPGNIMINKDGQAKIMDFGIARSQTVSDQAREVVGTPPYMSPEQVRGKGFGGQSDQYSLATIAYQALTGRLPFTAKPVPELFEQIVAEPPPPLRRENWTLPEGLEGVFQTALSKEPVQRFESCSQFVERLRTVLDQGPDWDCPSRLRERVERDRAGAEGGPTMIHVPSPPELVEPEIAPPSPATDDGTLHPGDFVAPSPRSSSPGTSTQAFRAADELRDAPAPTQFFDSQVFGQTDYFSGASARIEKIEETFGFYRDRLSTQYDRLDQQARVTYILWVVCVALAFAAILAGIILVLIGRTEQGAVTAIGGVAVGFIQKIFQQREDHYRKAADKKAKHLEYGNQWLLTVQSISSMEDEERRRKLQARLAEALTEKLRAKKKEPEP